MFSLTSCQHDQSGTSCAPGGSAGNYIMYPSATDGTRPNNNRFSECSVKDMGATIESNGVCFLKREHYSLQLLHFCTVVVAPYKELHLIF